MHFYALANAWTPWLFGISATLFLAGLYGGLVLAPADYQQGESFRIIYVHVPSAWLSMFSYLIMAVAGAAKGSFAILALGLIIGIVLMAVASHYWIVGT